MAEQALEGCTERWNEKYPAISPALAGRLEPTDSLFRLPAEVRRGPAIYNDERQRRSRMAARRADIRESPTLSFTFLFPLSSASFLCLFKNVTRPQRFCILVGPGARCRAILIKTNAESLNPMNILLIGNGGREHALAWRLAQSPRAETVYVAPGNGGTALEAGIENVDIPVSDIEGLVAFARANAIDLTVVGPEAPLVAGIVDAFDAAGLRCFGPCRAAARLEGSKDFSKAFMNRHGIPTAAHASFTDLTEALAHIRRCGAPIVVKADGLAAGKGVVVARTVAEAEEAVRDMLAGNRFGEAGHRVVIEEFLEGEEASFIVMVDGEHALAMATSQDHKARDEGDRGPNTGGMGAYTPAPVVDESLHARVMDEVIRPVITGMANEGHPYRGFLYAGLMISPDGGVRVLEFNCRFGDPETQAIMMRLRSDLVELCEAALDGRLDTVDADWDPRPAIGVVLASAGYPGDYPSGELIEGLEPGETQDVKVFHAGTRLDGDRIVTNGGRVLCVCALGDDLHTARERAYARIDGIRWPSMVYRRDIGHRALDHGAG